jgi:hypothetical protein
LGLRLGARLDPRHRYNHENSWWWVVGRPLARGDAFCIQGDDPFATSPFEFHGKSNQTKLESDSRNSLPNCCKLGVNSAASKSPMWAPIL